MTLAALFRQVRSVLLRPLAAILLLSLASCSGSEPPSCDDSGAQAQAWSLIMAKQLPNETITLGFGRFQPDTQHPYYTDSRGRLFMIGVDPITITRDGLVAAVQWTMSAARMAKYDSEIHKRWCQADLSASLDTSKANESAITYPSSDPQHYIYNHSASESAAAPLHRFTIADAVAIQFQYVRYPSVAEYAIQRTDNGSTYVTLESAP